MSNNYTLIVPALDKTGPVNVAFDLGRVAASRGWRVCLLYLSSNVSRNDVEFATEVRQFKFADISRLRGVVHTHCLRPDLLGWIISWNKKCRLITTVHNFFLLDISFDYSRIRVWIAWQLWRRALMRFSHVVCISNSMKRYYTRMLPELKLSLIRNFRPPPRSGVKLDSSVQSWIHKQKKSGVIVTAYVGSLSKRKNISSLLPALLDCQNCALLICGKGPHLAKLKTEVLTLGLGHRVLFAGQLDDPTTALSLVDALLLPSFAEGFPLVVLEAASVGIPSLLSNIAVHRELSKLGFGITFNHRSFNDFQVKLEILLKTHPAPDIHLQALWRSDYTPQVGFMRYEMLMKESAREH